jgi:hypothetical protein
MEYLGKFFFIALKQSDPETTFFGTKRREWDNTDAG